MTALVEALDWPWRVFGFPRGVPEVELGEVVDAYVARTSELAAAWTGATAEEREALARRRAELDEAFDVLCGERLRDGTAGPAFETAFVYRNGRVTGPQAQRIATLVDHAARTGRPSVTLVVHFGMRDDIDAPWLVRVGDRAPGNAVYVVYENGALADLATDGLVLDGEESAEIGWLVLVALGAAVPPPGVVAQIVAGMDAWIAREVEAAAARLAAGDGRAAWVATCPSCGRRWELLYRFGVCCFCHGELPLSGMVAVDPPPDARGAGAPDARA